MSVAEIMTVGEAMAKSGFFSDCRQASQAVVKIMAGRELGFSPIAAMTGVHIIEGKPTVGSHLLAALIRRSGAYDYEIKHLDAARCDLAFSRMVGGKWQAVGAVSVTMADLVANGVATAGNGKLKANYQRAPDDMLFARAISKGYKRYCPDLTFGVTVYAEGEIESDDRPATTAAPAATEVVTPDGEVIQAQPVIEVAEPQPAPPAVTDYCGSCSDIQLGVLDQLTYELQCSKERWAKTLATFSREENGQAVPVTDAKQLSAGQADDLIVRLQKAVDAKKARDAGKSPAPSAA